MLSSTSGKTTPIEGVTDDDAKKVCSALNLKNTQAWGDEELVKLTRQLKFAASTSGGGVEALLQNILSSRSDDAKRVMVPKRRYGKTELQMPILTCGGMRLQETWMPDNVPLLGSRSPIVGFGMAAIKTSCQNNLVATIRRALAIGVNHFETARFYGTSEMQFADALFSMISSGEIKREDFILQTKIPPQAKLAEFKKGWTLSWELFSKLGYVDLLSAHGLSKEEQYKWVFDNGDESNIAFMRSLVAEGKVRHIGFATHGTPAIVAKILRTNAFSYVNLHSHGVFGDYHGSAISDGAGGYGHRANVELAKSLDMGVFIISPFDKGGKLYEPSSTLKEVLGPQLSAIEFQALYQWSELGNADTVVVGASKPSDFDEALGVLQRFNLADPATAQMVRDAAGRIRAALDRAAGEGGLAALYQGLPDHTDPASDGIAIAHMVWLWALVKGLGLYSYAKERFESLEGCAKTWRQDKSAEENILAWNGFNTGRSLASKAEAIPAEALAKCPDAARIRNIVSELHSWFAADGDAKPTPQQLSERGWAAAYSLRTWPDFPGLSVNITGVLLQRLTGGLAGIGGGPSKDSSYVDEVKRTRAYWNAVATA